MRWSQETLTIKVWRSREMEAVDACLGLTGTGVVAECQGGHELVLRKCVE